MQEPSIQNLVGQVLADMWFSDYSICYLELGELQPHSILANGRVGSPRGQFTIFLGYDWSAEFAGLHKTRLELHAHPSERDLLVERLLGTSIQKIDVISDDLELEISFASGVVLRTRSSEGDQSDWSVRFSGSLNGYLHVQERPLTFDLKA